MATRPPRRNVTNVDDAQTLTAIVAANSADMSYRGKAPASLRSLRPTPERTPVTTLGGHGCENKRERNE